MPLYYQRVYALRWAHMAVHLLEMRSYLQMRVWCRDAVVCRWRREIRPAATNSRAPLSAEEQEEISRLQGELEVYKRKLKRARTVALGDPEAFHAPLTPSAGADTVRRAASPTSDLLRRRRSRSLPASWPRP